MELAQHSLALLGGVLLVGLLIPDLLQRFRVPFTSSLILVGALVGPHGLGYVEPDSTLTVVAFLGATFQMLLSGFEAHELDLRLMDRGNLILFGLNGVVPAGIGAAIAWAFGYSWQGALLTGAIFMSSSILVVFAFLRHFGQSTEGLGQRLRALVVLEELGSTLLAFVLLKSVTPHSRFPLPILVGLVLGSVAALRMFMPEIVGFAFARLQGPADRVRFVLGLMLVVLFVYAALDVHAVVAAFLVGFSLASIDGAEALRERLHLLGYALFIPVFLFVVGLDTDFRLLGQLGPDNLLVAALVGAAILSKLGGGYLGGRLVGFAPHSALVLGLGSTTKMTVPITATYAALKAGIIGNDLFTAVVLMSITTTLLIPVALELMLRHRESDDEARGA